MARDVFQVFLPRMEVSSTSPSSEVSLARPADGGGGNQAAAVAGGAQVVKAVVHLLGG